MGLFVCSENESGTIKAIGIGESTIDLDFKPEKITYQIQDDPHDPGPLSCNPVAKETLTISQSKHKTKYRLLFKWHVFGVKHISWEASSD